MSGSPLVEAGQFLVSTIFDIYLIIVALRFLFQCTQVDFYNPLSQFVVKATNHPLKYLRRWIPEYAGIDWSSLLLMIVIKIVEIVLMLLIGSGRIPSVMGLLVISFAEILQLMIYIFTFTIFIQIFISWINPGTCNHVTVILYKLIDPLLRPARKLAPTVSGLDFSPLLVLIALQLGLILFIHPLLKLGYSLSGYDF